MNSDESTRGLADGAEPDKDENHDETRRNFASVISEPGSKSEDRDSTSRDQNHDESRINAFDPDVASAIGSKSVEK